MGQCAIVRKISATLAIFGLVLLLAGCLFSPGKFVSALDLRRDGQFTYTYQGEIHVMALSDLASKTEASQPFSASACHDYDEDGNEQVRECTADELDAQKADWKAQQDRADQKRKQDAEQFRGVMGGFDPTDPKAAEELAQRLRKQAGFRSVAYKGNGLYLGSGPIKWLAMGMIG